MNTHSHTYHIVAWSVAIGMAEIFNQMYGAYPLRFLPGPSTDSRSWLVVVIGHNASKWAKPCRINTMSRPLQECGKSGIIT